MSSKVEPLGKEGADPAVHDSKDMHKLDLPKDQLGNGPVMKRNCTDCICCLLFLMFCVGMVGTAIYGFMNGDPYLLLTTWDYDENGCGFNETTKNYPYLYFPGPDISNISSNPLDAFKYSVCVSSCPTSNENTPVFCKEPSFFVSSNVKFVNCTYYPFAYKFTNNTIYRGPGLRYDTEPILGKYCMPTSEALKNTTIKIFQDNFNKYFDVNKITGYVADIFDVWYVIAICVGVAFILGLLYLILLRLCASIIVFITLVGILLGLGGAGFWLYMMKDGYSTTSQSYKYCLYGAYALWGVDGLYALILLCLCNRLRLGVAVIKCTAQFIGATPQILLIPIVFSLLCGIWIAGWAFSAVFLFSVGSIEPREPPLQFVTQVVWEPQTRYLCLYHLFGLLWLNAFLIGCSQFIIASACAMWYFSFTSDTKGKGSVCKGILWIFRYHLGSIAFGSFIIALVQFIKLIFEYYRQKIQKASKNNPVVKCLLCVTGYLISCLERCVKYITKNAYIQVAITSKSFCPAAWNGFLLVVKNCLRYGALHSIGCVFMFLGKLFIIVGTGLVCYALLNYWKQAHEAVQTPYGPVFVCAVIGYVVGSLFISVFSFASDTILQCFFLDEELVSSSNRPAGNRPPLMNDFVNDPRLKKGCCCCH